MTGAKGAMLDWDSVTWTAGSLSRSFDVDSSNAGNDVSVAITGSTSRFLASYPQINSSQTGGLSPAQKSLELYTDFSKRNQSITVTVNFNYAQGVTGVNFSLFDVDLGTRFVDLVKNITATDASGNTVAATITDSANNSVSGSGTGQTIRGTAATASTSGDANATISFGSAYITSFTFTYTSGSKLGNPASQSISFHDINFTPVVPEAGTVGAALAVCLLAAMFSRRRFSRKLAPAC